MPRESTSDTSFQGFTESGRWQSQVLCAERCRAPPLVQGIPWRQLSRTDPAHRRIHLVSHKPSSICPYMGVISTKTPSPTEGPTIMLLHLKVPHCVLMDNILGTGGMYTQCIYCRWSMVQSTSSNVGPIL